MTTPKGKLIFRTFSETAAAYLYKHGAKVKVAYAVDELKCFEVVTKGRTLNRVYESAEFEGYLPDHKTKATLVAHKRMVFPTYVIAADNYLMFCNREEVLRGLREDCPVTTVDSTATLRAVLDTAKATGEKIITIFSDGLMEQFSMDTFDDFNPVKPEAPPTP